MAAAVPAGGRLAHWVLRVSELKPTLTFFQKVFGMTVIRHEENAKACDMTCNGRYNNSWSKTMVGYKGRLEDKWFCLELTYNYGVKGYAADDGLIGFSMGVAGRAGVEEVLGRAGELGYRVEGGRDLGVNLRGRGGMGGEVWGLEVWGTRFFGSVGI